MRSTAGGFVPCRGAEADGGAPADSRTCRVSRTGCHNSDASFSPSHCESGYTAAAECKTDAARAAESALATSQTTPGVAQTPAPSQTPQRNASQPLRTAVVATPARPIVAPARRPIPSRRAPGEPGHVAWRYPPAIPGQEAACGALRNCPAVDSAGRLIVALGPRVVALVEENSDLRTVWQYETRGSIPGSPVIGPDQQVRVHSSDGRLHILDATGQAACPPVTVGEPLGWAAPLVDTQNNCWISAYRGGLLRVDAAGSTGRQPYFRSRHRFDSTGLIRDGVCYLGGEDGFVHAIKTLGTRAQHAWPRSDAAGKTEWFINSALAWGTNNTLIVAGRDEFLYGFDSAGQQLWKLHVRGQMLGAPVVDAGGDIYVGVSLLERGHAPRGKLECVAADGRHVRWEYAADGPVESTPVLGSDGVVYFGDNAGTVHAVTSDGRAAWKEPVGAAVRSAATLVAAGRLVFGLDDGSLVGMQCGSPALASGGWPKYLADLANSGRAASG